MIDLLPNPHLTKCSKIVNRDKSPPSLTKNSKTIMSSKAIFKDNKTKTPKDYIDHLKPLKTSDKNPNQQLYIKDKEELTKYQNGAGGLAWLRYRLDMAGVVGSNPTRPI